MVGRVAVFVVMILLALALLGIGALLLHPAVNEFLRARSSGNYWGPFLPDAQGQYGALCRNPYLRVLRAQEEGSGFGLVARWAFWVTLAGVVLACVLTIVVKAVLRLAGH